MCGSHYLLVHGYGFNSDSRISAWQSNKNGNLLIARRWQDCCVDAHDLLIVIVTYDFVHSFEGGNISNSDRPRCHERVKRINKCIWINRMRNTNSKSIWRQQSSIKFSCEMNRDCRKEFQPNERHSDANDRICIRIMHTSNGIRCDVQHVCIYFLLATHFCRSFFLFSHIQFHCLLPHAVTQHIFHFIFHRRRSFRFFFSLPPICASGLCVYLYVLQLVRDADN